MVSSNSVQLHEKERASGASSDRLAGRTYNVEGVHDSESRSIGGHNSTRVHWITMTDVGFCATVYWITMEADRGFCTRVQWETKQERIRGLKRR